MADIVGDRKKDGVKTATQTFSDIDSFRNWLSSQPPNSSGYPYTVKLNINEAEMVKLKDVLSDNNNKYVKFDLSGSSSITTIPLEAFTSLGNLVGITIPNNVIYIAESAFEACPNLTSVIIPNGVVSIGNGAFESCQSLKSVTIPSSVSGLNPYAFANCDSLTSVTFLGSIASNEFIPSAFDGDLCFKYTNGGGAGTYTRQSNSTTWTKQ